MITMTIKVTETKQGLGTHVLVERDDPSPVENLLIMTIQKLMALVTGEHIEGE